MLSRSDTALSFQNFVYVWESLVLPIKPCLNGSLSVQNLHISFLCSFRSNGYRALAFSPYNVVVNVIHVYLRTSYMYGAFHSLKNKSEACFNLHLPCILCKTNDTDHSGVYIMMVSTQFPTYRSKVIIMMLSKTSRFLHKCVFPVRNKVIL